MEPSSKGPKLRRPGDSPRRYGVDDDQFTVEIHHSSIFCGFGESKCYVGGKVAHFDGCEADTWSPLWLTDFMEQLGYKQQQNYLLYWLLPGMNLDKGLRIVDSDRDCLGMISVVPKFHFFQLFADHKDRNVGTGNGIDDVVISGSSPLPPVISPKSGAGNNASSSSNAGSKRAAENVEQSFRVGDMQEPRRSRRKLDVEEEAEGADSDNDSEDDGDWVDSDNEVAADDDDLFDEWVDDKLEQKKKNTWEEDSDYDTDASLEKLDDSDMEEEDPAEDVVMVDKQGKKTVKKKVKLTRWRAEMMQKVEFKIGLVFLSVKELRDALQEYIVQQRVGVQYVKNDRQRIRARCEEGCGWYFFAAPDTRTDTWVVKKYQKEHDCEREFEYLNAIDPRQWCKAYFEDLPKCDLLLNNICEVFHKYILEAREMPIGTCLKRIKDQLMTRFYSKMKESEDMCGTICPKIRKKLDKNIDFANNYSALPAAENLFKVIGVYGEYEVHIKKMECSCRSWQLTGIPCRHACACLRHARIKPESVVHKCYSIEAYKKCYANAIMPCSDPRIWRKTNGPEMRPPKFDKQVGRPSKKRKKNLVEEEEGTRLSRHGTVGHCSRCNKTGHNKRKCPEKKDVANIVDDPILDEDIHVPIVDEDIHVPIQVVHADDEIPEPQRKKLPVKTTARSTAKPSPRQHKKAAMRKPVQSSYSAPSFAASSLTYDMTTSSVMDILQDQAASTQQSQTQLPGPIPENQFIAGSRDALPPPRPTTATLGLKRRKTVQKKENIKPK